MKIEIAKRIVTVVATMLLFVAAISHAQSGWSGMTIGSGGKDLNAVYFADSKRGWVGGDDGFFSHTEDGGATWIERRIGTDHAINHVHFTSTDGLSAPAEQLCTLTTPARHGSHRNREPRTLFFTLIFATSTRDG